MQQIYVAILDEGTDVWRPVEAVEVSKGLFRIVSKNAHPDNEHWEFTTGEIVRCQSKEFSGGSVGLVAVELAMKNFMVIDGAQNSTYDIFGVDKKIFDIVFPDNSDIAFLDEVSSRVIALGLDEGDFINELYSNKLEKRSIRGLHGILHSTGSPSNKEYYPTRKESDVIGK